MSALFLATCWGQIAITSEQIRYCAGAFGIAITLASILISWHKRSFTWAPLYVVVALLHPSWTMSLEAGDCGLAMRFLSVAASFVLTAILTCQIFWPRLGRRRFLLSVSVISWAAYLLCWPLDAILSDLWGFPGPGGGFASQAFLSWRAAVNCVLVISVALTLVCSVQGIFDWLRGRRLLQANRPIQISEDGTLAPGERNAEAITSSQSKSRLRVLSLVILLGLIALYVGSLVLRPDIDLPTILAVAWSAILTIIAVRGKFPGWQLAEYNDVVAYEATNRRLSVGES